jgi:hypothetical protein
MMKVGFTGTQRGLTKAQSFTLAKILHKLTKHRMSEFHHGDCIGADKRAHDMVFSLHADVKIVIHPPENESKRAFCRSEHIMPAKDYLARNQDIVDECHVLLACPGEVEEQQRSGTWATVRRARKAKKSVWFIFPSGDERIEEAR